MKFLVMMFVMIFVIAILVGSTFYFGGMEFVSFFFPIGKREEMQTGFGKISSPSATTTVPSL